MLDHSWIGMPGIRSVVVAGSQLFLSTQERRECVLQLILHLYQHHKEEQLQFYLSPAREKLASRGKEFPTFRSPERILQSLWQL